MNAGSGLFTSILHQEFKDSLLPWGKRLELAETFKAARAGALHPQGAMSVAARGGNFLVVDFDVEQTDVRVGIAPASIVFQVDGRAEYLLCYIGWHDRPDSKTLLTLFPSVWDATLAKMVPDSSHPIGFANGKVGIWGFRRTLDPTYHLLIDNPFSTF